jgi:hypothetical protein
VDDFFDVDDGWVGTVTNLTFQATGSLSSYKSMLEVGSSGLATQGTFINLNFIIANGDTITGDVTDFYSTSAPAINIRDGASSVSVNTFTSLSGTSDSTNNFPLSDTGVTAYQFGGSSAVVTDDAAAVDDAPATDDVGNAPASSSSSDSMGLLAGIAVLAILVAVLSAYIIYMKCSKGPTEERSQRVSICLPSCISPFK